MNTFVHECNAYCSEVNEEHCIVIYSEPYWSEEAIAPELERLFYIKVIELRPTREASPIAMNYECAHTAAPSQSEDFTGKIAWLLRYHDLKP